MRPFVLADNLGLPYFTFYADDSSKGKRAV